VTTKSAKRAKRDASWVIEKFTKKVRAMVQDFTSVAHLAVPEFRKNSEIGVHEKHEGHEKKDLLRFPRLLTLEMS
jgi:hypothetical protein